MRKKKENYLVKGEYEHPQASGFLAVKQYMFIEQDGKHCLLLRFENEMELPITEAAITVTQLDAEDKTLGNIDIRYDDINVGKKKTFCPKSAIVVDGACSDFIVTVRYVICKNIKYEVRGEQLVGHYDKRGYERDSARRGVEKKVLKGKRRYIGYEYYRFIAFVSLLLAIISLFSIKALLDNKAKTESFRASHYYNTEVSDPAETTANT